jgi:hypothetical protein
VNLCLQDNEGVFLAAGHSAANQAACIDLSIIEGALTPEQTSSYQAADRAQGGFRAVKATVRKNRLDGNVPVNEVVQEGLESAFEGLKLKYPHVKVSKVHQTNIIQAALDMLHAGQEVMSPQKMRESFVIFGAHRPLRTGEDPALTSSVEFFRWMAECYANIPQSVLEAMYSKRDIFADILRRNAKFTTADFDFHDIPKSVYSKDLTDAAWGRGWAFVMSHPVVIADMARKRHEASEEFRTTQRIATEQTRAEAAEVASAEKLVEAQRKKEAAALAKKTAVAALRALPKEEQERIKSVQRLAKAQKRVEKENVLKNAKRKLGINDSESEDSGEDA